MVVSRRASSGPARVGGRGFAKAGRVRFQERFERGSRDSRERAARRRVVLNCPVLDIAHRRLVNQCSVWAEPRLHGYFCKAHDHSSSDI